MKILGISAFYHDSAAVLVEDGEITAAAQEERFTRKKHDKDFPVNAVNFCLSQRDVQASELDAVVFYEKPLLKFERLLETYYAFAPGGFRSFFTAMPVWIKEKLFLKDLIGGELGKLGVSKDIKLLFPEHHLSHAASAFFPSPFAEAAVLTVDGVGEWATSTIGHGKGNSVKLLRELRFPHSVGLLYSAFTYYLGFKVNSGEYKLMGLAPYGDPDSARTRDFARIIREKLADVKQDGSVFLNQEYFDYCAGLVMCRDRAWEKLFGFGPRKPESEIDQRHCDLAMAIQEVAEEIMLKMAGTARELTGSENLCLAGGVALNCVANGKILRSGLFKKVWVQPASGDAGGALGAALAAHHMYFGAERPEKSGDSMKGSFLGPEFGFREVQRTIRKYKAKCEIMPDEEELCSKVAGLLDGGSVVGWFQGRMEWGPRALGNRSILGDPRNPEMQKKLNLKIKFRESFRPFAPSVLWEDCSSLFEMDAPSPYMLFTAGVKDKITAGLPGNWRALPVREKLYFKRSGLPAVTHLDYSARLQTVHRETNPRYHKLLARFKERTGCAALVNTSFNVRGEPIVCTPDDAYRCFMRTGMDYLVLGDCLFDKKVQPEWPEKEEWKLEYGLD